MISHQNSIHFVSIHLFIPSNQKLWFMCCVCDFILYSFSIAHLSNVRTTTKSTESEREREGGGIASEHIKFPNLIINSVHANWLHPLCLAMSVIMYASARTHTVSRHCKQFFPISYIGLMDFNSRIVLVQIEMFTFISSNQKLTQPN